MRKDVTDLLYNFNKTKLEDLLNNSEFSKLFIHYLEQPELLEHISNDKSNQLVVKAYRKQVQYLKSLCTSNH